MEFGLSDDLVALQRAAQAVATTWRARVETPEDSWIVGTSREMSLELAERGWLGMTWPISEGGRGRPPLERVVVFEALIGGGAPVATSWFADRQIGPTLLQFGTEQQRRRFLPEIISGESAWSIGMSEPDAGSDVAAIRTRAVRDGSDWVIDGRKVWTSGAAVADWCYVVARTDPDAPPHAGLSELIVDMHAPGIEIAPILDMTGSRHFCEVTYDGVRVPAENLVGEENGSFRQIMQQMEHERGGIDRLVSNRALYDDCVPLADRDDPRVRQEIAALEADYRVGRHLVLREILGQAPKGFSAATKTFCTEFEQRVAEFCGRVYGAETLLWNRASRSICYAPGYTIMGGTTQILRNIIGERLLGLPREPRAAG
jgi:alkylation response protein AidB-like acyl-CoA dehydrogenase